MTGSPTDLRPRRASPEELETWDRIAVDGFAGHVLQSLAWGEHRRRTGWRADHWVFPDGSRALVLRRPWPLLPGESAYVPRGPIPATPTTDRAGLLVALGQALAGEGVDVLAADPEVPAAAPGYLDRIRAAGFRPIEEIQPARHRLALALDPASGEEAAFARIARPTRQRIRAAERAGLVVVRYDGRGGDPGPGFVAPVEPPEVAFERFADLLARTGERRGFGFDRADFLGWWLAAHAAGHLVLLLAHEPSSGVGLGAEGPGGGPIAGLLLYRHGCRLSTVHSGDLAEARRRTPGALHLLRWRAIQLALREERRELDLGGVDRPGARRIPEPGEPLYGLYEHKRSFGAEWVELAGAHELVVRPIRYAAGRALARAARLLRRR
ncbi:MAG TPA: hypothetical protein VNO86_11205 [Candidatus Binatia bacterium]|nr:hypothetical protein [Candidatus Binatia bacterium]